MATTAATLTTITPMTIMRTTIRPDGGASSIRPTTRTSARCTWCSRSSRASSARAMSIAIRAELMYPGHPDLPRHPHLQRVRDLARPDHDLLHGDAGDDRRLRQLVRAADDRRARHGVPAHEQHLVLAAAGLVRAAADLDLRRGRTGRQRRRRGLDACTRRCRPRAIPGRRSISPSCRCIWPAPRRSSAPSTSSPRSSTCARRA